MNTDTVCGQTCRLMYAVVYKCKRVGYYFIWCTDGKRNSLTFVLEYVIVDVRDEDGSLQTLCAFVRYYSFFEEKFWQQIQLSTLKLALQADVNTCGLH